MKRILTAMVPIFFVLLLVACAGGENEEQNQNTSNNTSENEEEAKENEQTSNLGKRSNPVPVGESVTLSSNVYSDDGEEAKGEFTISLTNFQRGQEVMDFLLSENQFNEQPPEGHEWMMFDVSIEANIDNPDISYYVAPSFNVLDANGSPVPQDIYPTFDTGEFGYEDLYDGGKLTGKAAVVVPTDEEVLVEYSDFDVEAFFKAE
ncbi:hypothetical protein [Ornithinibacillus halotolerans]|uniref:DUF4352 domain-containing protein n=1 Tax=Ornithinibacillus halotolerans TaxID=1274357 RepID=A0A916RUU0_9BACI|nr:hypothetical protein [Ornithinibacillus halotolerans]GGA71467.1 hypothetical protein GCM10008025_14210 [Ornithinibacillus halotolerans]